MSERWPLRVGNALCDVERKKRVAERNEWLLRNAHQYTYQELAFGFRTGASRVRAICSELGISAKKTVQAKEEPKTDQVQDAHWRFEKIHEWDQRRRGGRRA